MSISYASISKHIKADMQHNIVLGKKWNYFHTSSRRLQQTIYDKLINAFS